MPHPIKELGSEEFDKLYQEAMFVQARDYVDPKERIVRGDAPHVAILKLVLQMSNLRERIERFED